MSSRWLRNSFIYLLILIAVIAIVVSFFRQGDDPESLDFSQVVAAARDKNVEKIEVNGQSLKVDLRSDDKDYKSRIGKNVDLEQNLRDENVQIGGDGGVEVKYKNPSPFGNWLGLLLNFLALPRELLH